MATSNSSKKKSGKPGSTTQRVDHETLTWIKSMNYHLYKSKGINMSQSELIKIALYFSFLQEAEFLDFIASGKVSSKENAFDTLVKVTGRPWFPYGNLVK
ncbi:MAG: hypothetical protein V1875_07310, partial [Candidatus Altiarchaeota archaeon]